MSVAARSRVFAVLPILPLVALLRAQAQGDPERCRRFAA
jgi:hypothetical protein